MPVFNSINEGLDWLIRFVSERGIEGLFHRFYGTYSGKVSDVRDPDREGKVKLVIPVLGSDEPYGIWARPMFPGAAAKHGFYFTPEVGDQVWVTFENGDSKRPLYQGGPVIKAQYPDEFKSINADVRGIRTPSGILIRFSDDPLDTNVVIEHPTGSALNLSKEGNVLLMGSNGSNLFINSEAGETTLIDKTGAMVSMVEGAVTLVSKEGRTIEVGDEITVMSTGKININGGASVNIISGNVKLGAGVMDSLVKGGTFTALFNVHTHPCTSPGTPSGPPIIPMTAAHTTLNVKGS